MASALILFSSFPKQSNQSPKSRVQSGLITIEFLPSDDVIYKIADELDFENWNFGIRLEGLSAVAEIDRLEIIYFSKQTQVHLVEYSGNSIAEFLKTEENENITMHNFHHMLPIAVATDSLQLEIYFNLKSLGKKSVKLQRYKQHNQYRLPISGTWFVSSGHDFGVEHRRHLTRGHFAWDFVRIDESGHVGNGLELNDNFSYGQSVLAPAPGIVVDLHDGEPDNEPGALNGVRAANYVEIDHGNGEISRAVHLKNGSLAVSKGDSVVAGQIIAAVGNSGNSESPHLHFGFHRNAPDGRGGYKQIPIPILFSNYRVSWNKGTGILTKAGRPRRGQFVRQD